MLNTLKNKTHRFLIWSQKYTQTDNIYLARGGFWLTLEQAVSTVSGFLLAVAFANLLPPATYGTYRYILSLTGIFGVFALSGIKIAIVQAAARGLEGSFYTGFKTKLKWGTLGSLVAVVGAVYYWLQGNSLLPIPLLITAIFLPLMLASHVYGGFLAGRKLFGVGATYGIITNLVSVAGMVIALFLTKNLLWLIAVYFVSNTFLNYFFYLWTKFKLRPNKKEDGQTISYGKHLSFMGIIGRATKEIDKVIIFTFIGPVEVAIYSFAVLIPTQISDILTNVSSIALPKLAVKSREEIGKNLMKKVWKLFILVGAIIVIYVAIAPFFYQIFFPQYLISVPYSQLFALSLVAFPAFFLTNVFRAKMMKTELYLLRAADALKLILLLVLVPFFGVLGAVLALLGTQIIKGIIIFSLYYLRFKPV